MRKLTFAFMLIAGASLLPSFSTGCGEGFHCCPGMPEFALVAVECSPEGDIVRCSYNACEATFDDPDPSTGCDVTGGAWWADCDPFAI